MLDENALELDKVLDDLEAYQEFLTDFFEKYDKKIPTLTRNEFEIQLIDFATTIESLRRILLEESNKN